MTAREILAQIWYRVSGEERRYLLREYQKELRSRCEANDRLDYVRNQLGRIDEALGAGVPDLARYTCSVTRQYLSRPFAVYVPDEHGLLVEPKPVSRPQPRVSPSVPR